MNALLSILIILINCYMFALFAHIVIEYLVRFGVTSYSNQIVAQIRTLTNAIVEPVLDHIRRFIPTIQNIDLSPLVLFIALIFIRNLIRLDIMPAL